MRRLIISFLIRLFFKEQRDIKKMPLGEELSKYRFVNKEDVEDILKHNRTIMTLWHYETFNQKEALLVKGMVLMLNILIEAHKKSIELNDEPDIEKRLHLWQKFKGVEKSKIWNNLIMAVRRGAK